MAPRTTSICRLDAVEDGKDADVVESVPELGRIYNVGRARLLVPLIVSTPLSNDPGMVSASKLDLRELSVYNRRQRVVESIEESPT